jgi:DNA-binding CsgD family transcriptional regulator
VLTERGLLAPSQGEVAAILRRLIPCERVELVAMDRGASQAWRRCWVDPQEPAAPTAGKSPLTVEENPFLSRLLWAADCAYPVRSCDVAPMCGAGYCQLAIPLIAGNHTMLAWLQRRSGTDFDEVDVVVAGLLQPGLCSGMRGLLVGRAPLTARELGVLELVATGLTATAVARRCGISVRTVHKHLENVYRKLGCADRLSAVLAAREAGFLAVRSHGLTESRASA